MLAGVGSGRADPTEDASESAQNRPDRTRFPLDEIDIFRVPGGRGEMEFVQRGSPTKRERRLQERITEDVEQGQRDDQVLLDVVVGPGRGIAPTDNIDPRKHPFSPLLAAATALVAFYLAAGVRSLVYALAPERIVVGGGLSVMPGLIEATRAELASELGGYPGTPEQQKEDFLVLAGLGSMAGPAGTLILAERAAAATGRSPRVEDGDDRAPNQGIVG